MRDRIETRRRRVQTILQRRPPAKAKRLGRMAHPDAAALAFEKHIKAVLRDAERLVTAQLLPLVARLVKEAQTRADSAEVVRRADGSGDEVSRVLNRLAGEMVRSWPNDRLAAMAKEAGRRTSEFNRDQIRRVFGDALGIDVMTAETWLPDKIADFTAANVKLIRSVPTQYLSQVEDVVLNGVRQGRRHESLVTDIARRGDVARSRAELIARDQVSKFNGELNQARQKDVGLKSYTWRTVRDNRVRDDHVDRDGEVFEWSDPPEDGHPGQPVNCRCYAEPNIAELLDTL